MSRRRERGYLKLPDVKRLVRCVRQALEWLVVERARAARAQARKNRAVASLPRRIYVEAFELLLLLSADWITLCRPRSRSCVLSAKSS
jgi:hypothetical protein